MKFHLSFQHLMVCAHSFRCSFLWLFSCNRWPYFGLYDCFKRTIIIPLYLSFLCQSYAIYPWRQEWIGLSIARASRTVQSPSKSRTVDRPSDIHHRNKITHQADWVHATKSTRALVMRSRKISNPWDCMLKCLCCFEIWHALRQHCCRIACPFQND